MKILLTGFEPFGGEEYNPSWDAVELVDIPEETCTSTREGGVELVKLRLPVSFRRAPQLAVEAIELERPDAVICVGQAGGRACVNIERIAVNLANAKNPDADGNRPIGERVVEGAPDAYFSTVDVDAMVSAVRAAGIPCHLSNSAGLYVCNTLLFSLLHRFPEIPIMFVHLPYSMQQAIKKGKDTPSMSLPSMSAALSAIISEFRFGIVLSEISE